VLDQSSWESNAEGPPGTTSCARAVP
jgi:hypothetical protein